MDPTILWGPGFLNQAPTLVGSGGMGYRDYHKRPSGTTVDDINSEITDHFGA